MTVKFFSLYNLALAGSAAGMSSQKQALVENNSSTPVQPADSTALLTTCAAYATEVDALLQTLTPSSATNVTGLVSGEATVVPASPATADAAAYLPVVMGLMSKSTMDGRGIPTNPTTGAVYVQADWTASGIPNGVAAYFLAFSEAVFPDGAGSTVKYVPLANVAMGAAMAGMISNRQELFGPSGAPLTSANFTVHTTTAKAFATQVDAALQAASGVPTNVTGLVSGSANDYSTVVPNTPALQNALDSLPVAMGALCKAIFDNRGIPRDANGVAYVQADYVDIANTVVAQFLQFAANTSNT